MMENTLWELKADEGCTISNLKDDCAMAQRLTELGFIPGEHTVKLLQNRGMAAYLLRGTLIALRRADADCVCIREDSHDGK